MALKCLLKGHCASYRASLEYDHLQTCLKHDFHQSRYKSVIKWACQSACDKITLEQRKATSHLKLKPKAGPYYQGESFCILLSVGMGEFAAIMGSSYQLLSAARVSSPRSNSVSLQSLIHFPNVFIMKHVWRPLPHLPG